MISVPLQADCDKYAYDLERSELQHQKAQGGLDKSQEEVARLQVELEKLYDKHDKTQMEFRQTVSQLEKYKEETATLEAEVDRFAGRLGKYQVRSHNIILMEVSEGLLNGVRKKPFKFIIRGVIIICKCKALTGALP